MVDDRSDEEREEEERFQSLYGRWEAPSPADVRARLEGAPFRWWIAGGWAVEGLGGRRRRHGPPVENTGDDGRNPLVPLPRPAEEIVRGLDLVLVTHLHRDLFDEAAVHVLPRDVPVLCQPEDEERLLALGLRARARRLAHPRTDV